MRYLAILLLAPWLLILCWAYWAYPKSLLRTRSRRWFDAIALLLAALAVIAGARLGFDLAVMPVAGQLGRPGGGIWQQVLPALYGYGALVGVLVPAILLRHATWGKRG
ncbi:MAG: hypothetical protein OQK79_07910 [Rhodanobacter sp.]|jgi:hypothetical protein|nr:hypothetical protein [Rhodanobacter sp.]